MRILLRKARFYYYLPIAYSRMIIFALKKGLRSLTDAKVLVFLAVTPFFYLLRFKGNLRTPFGTAIVLSRDKMRSLSYGVFKTYFSYLPEIRSLALTPRFSTVVDIGANIGDFTLALARLSERVIAVEPGAQNFATLQSNIRANKLVNTVALNVAAHDIDETVGLIGIDSTLYITTNGDGQPAPGLPMDSILSKLQTDTIDVLKVDVQGHESKVLRGMTHTLKRHMVRLLVVETHPIRGIRREDISNLMESHGYTLIKEDKYLFGQPHMYFSPSPN